MTIVNVELYSLVILIVLLSDYIVKFYGRFNLASSIWLTLAISTVFISISNIFLTMSDVYIVKLISMTVYLTSTLISSLSVYIYVKYLYITPKFSIKKEACYAVVSIIVCIIITLLYIFVSPVDYVLHSFERNIFNKLLILAVVPNAVICYAYIEHTIKTKGVLNHKLIATMLLTIIGLVFDTLNSSLFFVSSTFTLTVMIIYINKHEKMLNTDPLTGLANKRSLDTFILNLKDGILVAVFNIDIDKFKLINDNYGHIKGDVVLKTVANILRRSSRESDLVIRNGGDEFLIISEVRNESDAKKIVDRINSNLENYNKNAKISVSLSVGWGLYKSTDNSMESFMNFMKKIDEDMYIEKDKKHREMDKIEKKN